MFDRATHDILMKFLDKSAKDAEREISEKGALSEKYAIPLILKSQFNHIAHLDLELTAFREQMDKRFEQLTGSVDSRFGQVDKRFEQVDKRFEQVDKRFERLERNLFAGFAFLSSLLTIYRFVH